MHAQPAGMDADALLVALKSRNIDAAQALLAGQLSGINLDYAEEDGRTALHYAASAGDEAAALVEALAVKGASVNMLNAHGISPLQKAVMSDNSHVALALIKCGADINVRNARGQTALDLAKTTLFRDAMVRAASAAEKARTRLATGHKVTMEPDVAVEQPKVVEEAHAGAPNAAELRRLWQARQGQVAAAHGESPSSLAQYLAVHAGKAISGQDGGAGSVGGVDALVGRRLRAATAALLSSGKAGNLVDAAQRHAHTDAGDENISAARSTPTSASATLPRWLREVDASDSPAAPGRLPLPPLPRPSPHPRGEGSALWLPRQASGQVKAFSPTGSFTPSAAADASASPLFPQLTQLSTRLTMAAAEAAKGVRVAAEGVAGRLSARRSASLPADEALAADLAAADGRFGEHVASFIARFTAHCENGERRAAAAEAAVVEVPAVGAAASGVAAVESAATDVTAAEVAEVLLPPAAFAASAAGAAPAAAGSVAELPRVYDSVLREAAEMLLEFEASLLEVWRMHMPMRVTRAHEQPPAPTCMHVVARACACNALSHSFRVAGVIHRGSGSDNRV